MAKNPLLRQHLENLSNFEQNGGSQPDFRSTGASKPRRNKQLSNHPNEQRAPRSQHSPAKPKPQLGSGELLLQGATKLWEPRNQTPLLFNSKRRREFKGRNRPWTSHNQFEADAGRRGLKDQGWARDRLYSNEESQGQLLSMAQEHSNQLANLLMSGIRDAEVEQAVKVKRTQASVLSNTNSHDFSNWNPDMASQGQSAVEWRKREIVSKPSLAGTNT